MTNKQTNSFTLMDTVIKDKEIQDCIGKLKNNKSSGLDSIRNEMIKSGANTLLPCLKKYLTYRFPLVTTRQHGPKVKSHPFSRQGTIQTQIIVVVLQ